MKFILIYVTVLLALLAKEVSSKGLARRVPSGKGLAKEVSSKGLTKGVPSGKGLVKKVSSGNGAKGLAEGVSPQDDPSFCDGKTVGGGKQIPGGFCSTTVQGDIPSSGKMTSTLITAPSSEAVLASNTVFTVDVSIINLSTGSFSDPETQYYLDPQALDTDGSIKGHSHVTIQALDGSNNPPDAQTFAFFKGLNEQAQSGVLSVDVEDDDKGTKGLPAGRYRICTMSSSFGHQPVLMPVAKRGSQDDCIRISVQDEGDIPKKTDKPKTKDN